MDMQTNVSSPSKCQYPSSYALLGLWMALYLLLLPLLLFVLYVGYRHRKKPSALSNSDAFTFSIIPLELLSIVGTGIYIAADTFWIQDEAGNYLYNIAISGQMFIHALTCVNRYLAVVYPITYLHFKKRGGVRIRNISIAAVWIFAVGLRSFLKAVKDEKFDVIINISLAILVYAVVAFCSVSVLCALIRPGPGEGGRDVTRIGQSKLRAFVIIMAIMGVLMLRLLMLIVEYVMRKRLDEYRHCLLSLSLALLTFPSSLVLPLMFLQKYGNLPECSIMACKLQ